MGRDRVDTYSTGYRPLFTSLLLPYLPLFVFLTTTSVLTSLAPPSPAPNHRGVRAWSYSNSDLYGIN